MKQPHQIDTLVLPEPPPICLQDYVIALVLNEAGEAMIWEKPRPDGGTYWQVMERYLQLDEDPFTAVQQELLVQAGRQTGEWAYLGSHVIDTNQRAGVGYFFCAQQTREIATVVPQSKGADGMPLCRRWVPLTDLRYALLDGRLAMTNHALTVSLALLTILL